MNPYFQAGIQMSQQAMEREDGRADRELRTQMNRLKANDIIKGMEVDAEVKNFLVYAKKDAEALDKTHPGYASQLMGIVNTRTGDLSPAAYEKAVPMVRQFYDRFDARKLIEAENDQRALATDWMAAFKEPIQGISYTDAKFALGAKNNLNVDPVFAEKDGIRIFDRKGTDAAVKDAMLSQAAFGGKMKGEAKSSEMFETMPAEGTARLNDANFKAQQEQRKRESDELNRQFKDDEFVKKAIKSLFKTEIPLPDDDSERLTLVEFKNSIRHGKFPLQEDGQPDYAAGHKMIKDEKLATMRAEADAKRPPVDAAEDKFTEGEKKAANFFNMMKNVEDIVGGLPPDSQPGLASTAVGSIPLVGKTIARSGQSDATQRYVQASETWVRAKLRRESGAVIGVDEMKGELATFFPQVGDTAGTIAQKAALRLEAQKGLMMEAGRAIKTVGGGGGSIKVENGVLQAPSKAAAEAYLAANPNVSVNMLKIGKDYFEVKKTP